MFFPENANFIFFPYIKLEKTCQPATKQQEMSLNKGFGALAGWLAG